LNYAGTFEFEHFGDARADTMAGAAPSGSHSIASGTAPTVTVQDAQLLFSGDYARSGIDLVLSKDGHTHVIPDYFKGSQRAALSSPDGATLSPDLIKALVGEVQVAQLGGGANAAAQVIGSVTKLTGSATAIRNGVSVMLNVGDNVQKGDVVQAGADSSLGLTFIDGTVFGLSSNARMVLNEMVYDPNGSSNSSLLSLVQGTITFVAGETAKHGDMKVDTPVATMGIRGTAVLVEIGFEVASNNGVPVKFQVLVEPGGRVGSYFLYSKADPTQIIGQVNQAGQVTSVTGTGVTSVTAADPLPPIAQAIIQQTLQQYFPNYVPNANPRGTGPSGGSSPSDPNSGTSPDPLKFLPQPDGLPVTVPINLPGSAPNTPPVEVTVTRFNTAPIVTVAPIVVTLPVDKNSFEIKDQVHITDPDSGDVATPYVTGTARIISASGPNGTPASLDLKTLITVDPQTGHVSYDPAAFKFLAAGQTAVYTIGFDSQSGPDTTHETLTFTVDGSNDAPVVAAALTGEVAAGATVHAFNLLAGASDPDLGETARLSINHVTYALGGGTAQAGAPAGVTLQGTTLQVDPHAFAYLGAGETLQLAVSYDIVDAHGAVVHQTETLSIKGSNDAPVEVTGSVVAGSLDVPATGTGSGGIPGVSGAGILNGLGGSAGYGEFVLAAGDDNSSSPIDVTSVFGANGLNFFGHNYTQLYINNNGNITFGTALSTYTPSTINGGSTVPIIAAFWADVDTRGTGHVYYDLDPVDGIFTVTWDHVGYYSNGTDKVDSFQLQLISRGDGNFDIVYRYGDIQWTTGGASGGTGGLGGTPAYIGYSAGDGVHYYQAAESGHGEALLNIDHTPGNTGYDGVNGYEVRNGDVQTPALKSQGTINFSDADLHDVHTASVLPAEGHIGTLTLTKLSDTTGTGTGGQFGWLYAVDATAAQTALQGHDGNIVETFTVVIDDGHGGTINQDVSVTLTQPAVNHAPAIDTTEVLSRPGGSGDTLVSGISVTDPDSANSAFHYSATSDLLGADEQHGQILFHNGASSGDATSLTALNQLLSQTTTYSAPADAGGQETVHLTITDQKGASDTVNFVFHVGNVTPDSQVTLTGSDNAKDVIVATVGSDTMTGGSGADQFVFGPGSGHDTVTDFQVGTDKIDLRVPIYYSESENSFANWLRDHTTTSETGTTIHLDVNVAENPEGLANEHNSILLKGATGLQASDFIVHSMAV
jgi:VCBS repeat-containing protein